MSAVDTRNISRDSLFLMADVRLEGAPDSVRVKVRNLSAGGMMAESDMRVVRGARLAVKLRNVDWIDGNIAWVQDNRFGIAFDREIDPTEVRAPTPNSDDSSTPRYVRTVGYQPRDPGSSRLRKI